MTLLLNTTGEAAQRLNDAFIFGLDTWAVIAKIVIFVSFLAMGFLFYKSNTKAK